MASSIQDWVVQLGNENPAEAFAAFKELMDLATRATAPGSEAKCAEVAAALAVELNAQTPATKNEKGKEIPPQPKYTPRARAKICQLLTVVSGAKEVPALVKAMGDLQVREPARCALDRNESEEATDALIKALDEVGAEFRIGVVNSLGKRGNSKVAEVLRKAAASDKDPQVCITAVEALSNIPESANAGVVLKATKCKCNVTSVRAWKAAVRLAENLCKAGQKAESADLYRKIAAEAPDAQKAAAGIGLEV